MTAMMNEIIAKADVLLEALPYIQQFHGKTVLIKFGGSAMEDPELTKIKVKPFPKKKERSLKS